MSPTDNECPECDGSGVIRKNYTYRDSDGHWLRDVDELPCQACLGTGKTKVALQAAIEKVKNG